MAATKSTATPETALPDDGQAIIDGEAQSRYRGLIEAIKAKEEHDSSLRVTEISTDFANTPAHERLTYSYPPVVEGANGYKTSRGETILI